MDWSIEHENKDVEAAYAAFLSLINNISIQYAGNSVLQSIDFPKSLLEQKVALSSTFFDELTTIITFKDIEGLIKTGQYNQIALEMATVQLIAGFEHLLQRYKSIYQTSSNTTVFTESIFGKTVTRNETLMIIDSLHNDLEMDSVVKSDRSVYPRLLSIIEVRNCIVHSQGIVDSPTSKEKLKPYYSSIEVGEKILLTSELYDDFLHYIRSHMRSLAAALPNETP